MAKPAAMHRAHGLKCGTPGVPWKVAEPSPTGDQHEVQRFGNGRVSSLAMQHGLHHLQPRFARHLLRPGHARAAPLFSVQTTSFLGQPDFELGLRMGWWWDFQAVEWMGLAFGWGEIGRRGGRASRHHSGQPRWAGFQPHNRKS